MTRWSFGASPCRTFSFVVQGSYSLEQCIVNEYRPRQGIGMHAGLAHFGPVCGLAVARGRLADAVPAPERPPLRPRRTPGRRGRRVAPLLRTGARLHLPQLDARHRQDLLLGPGEARLRDLPQPE